MSLNKRRLYIDLVAYCSDFSNTYVKESFVGSKQEGLPRAENLLKRNEEKPLQRESRDKKEAKKIKKITIDNLAIIQFVEKYFYFLYG